MLQLLRVLSLPLPRHLKILFGIVGLADPYEALVQRQHLRVDGFSMVWVVVIQGLPADVALPQILAQNVGNEENGNDQAGQVEERTHIEFCPVPGSRCESEAS